VHGPTGRTNVPSTVRMVPSYLVVGSLWNDRSIDRTSFSVLPPSSSDVGRSMSWRTDHRVGAAKQGGVCRRDGTFFIPVSLTIVRYVWGEVYKRWFRWNGGRGRRSPFGGSHVVSLATNRSLLILCQIKRGFRGADVRNLTTSDTTRPQGCGGTANSDALEALGNEGLALGAPWQTGTFTPTVAIVCPLLVRLRLREANPIDRSLRRRRW
jgi:hypothetical protein